MIGGVGSLKRWESRLAGKRVCNRDNWAWFASSTGRRDRDCGRGMLGDEIVPRADGVLVSEPVTPIIAMATVLGLAGLSFEIAVFGAEAEIAMADGDALTGGNGGDRAAAIAVGAIKPVVQQ